MILTTTIEELSELVKTTLPEMFKRTAADPSAPLESRRRCIKSWAWVSERAEAVPYGKRAHV